MTPTLGPSVSIMPCPPVRLDELQARIVALVQGDGCEVRRVDDAIVVDLLILPSVEKIADAIKAWLDGHPEVKSIDFKGRAGEGTLPDAKNKHVKTAMRGLIRLAANVD